MLTPLERRVLKFARARIEARQERFVCFAITDALIAPKFRDVNHDRLHDATDRLIIYIQRQLGSTGTLERWHAVHRGKHPSYEQARRYRLQWIDWMLGRL